MSNNIVTRRQLRATRVLAGLAEKQLPQEATAFTNAQNAIGSSSTRTLE
jgi:hypothetical protein